MDTGKSVNILQQRSSGILLPIFSLPGPYGIGDLGIQAMQFVDFLHKAGQRFWQILPLGPTCEIFGNSPYMSSSAFAGNPLLINLDSLVADGLLTPAELKNSPGFSEYQIDYSSVTVWKSDLLKKSWHRFQSRAESLRLLHKFINTHPWLADHALYMALKQHHNQAPWYEWPQPLCQRQAKAVGKAQQTFAADILYFSFEQYLFFKQWEALRQYANEKGIRFIGDLPIYVGLDSVDVWCHQDIFQLEQTNGLPTDVAGVPPDYFSETGQRWGNPLYRWTTKDYGTKTKLWQWWEQRLSLNFSLVDVIRIDHFRGFESYWAVPADEETAINGRWLPGPGADFFLEMEKRLGSLPIIAEDLGLITPEVEALRNALGYPGMKILLFAFDGTTDNAYLPYNGEKNSVVYSGTHDNDTAVGWFLNPEVSEASKVLAKQLARRTDMDAGTFHFDVLYLAYASVANLAIIPLQDVLGFGNDCRINIPGTSIGNWQWRCAQPFLTQEVASALRGQVALFGRLAACKETEPPAS